MRRLPRKLENLIDLYFGHRIQILPGRFTPVEFLLKAVFDFSEISTSKGYTEGFIAKVPARCRTGTPAGGMYRGGIISNSFLNKK